MEMASAKSWMINACLSNVDEVCSDMSAWLMEQELASHRFPLELLVREGLNNAIIHGCQLNPSRQICCQLERVEDALLLKIEDDGAGFDWQTHLPNNDEETDHENGRGLQIYRLYSDFVGFNPRGNQVILIRLLKSKGK